MGLSFFFVFFGSSEPELNLNAIEAVSPNTSTAHPYISAKCPCTFPPAAPLHYEISRTHYMDDKGPSIGDGSPWEFISRISEMGQ